MGSKHIPFKSMPFYRSLTQNLTSHLTVGPAPLSPEGNNVLIDGLVIWFVFKQCASSNGSIHS